MDVILFNTNEHSHLCYVFSLFLFYLFKTGGHEYFPFDVRIPRYSYSKYGRFSFGNSWGFYLSSIQLIIQSATIRISSVFTISANVPPIGVHNFSQQQIKSYCVHFCDWCHTHEGCSNLRIIIISALIIIIIITFQFEWNF